DVAQAVAFAHSRGIVHRDLKPGQVMIGSFGETLLMDWGLAVFVGAGESADPADPAAMPQLFPADPPTRGSASHPAGTPALMAPEQTRHDASGIGPWTDIYLLGGSLYWLLTGAYPHKAKAAVEAMRLAMIGDIVPPSQRAPEGRSVPADLEAICLK